MVAVFIAWLKIALIGVLTATTIAPLAGIEDTTVGTVTVSRPHPATKITDRIASQCVTPNMNLRICVLSSSLGITASIALYSLG